jgi:hypothetical protein
MRRLQASLEDVFLELTTEEKMAEEGDDSRDGADLPDRIPPNHADSDRSKPEDSPDDAQANPSGGEVT